MSLVAETNVTIEILKPLNEFLGCEIIFGDGLAQLWKNLIIQLTYEPLSLNKLKLYQAKMVNRWKLQIFPIELP